MNNGRLAAQASYIPLSPIFALPRRESRKGWLMTSGSGQLGSHHVGTRLARNDGVKDPPLAYGRNGGKENR